MAISLYSGNKQLYLDGFVKHPKVGRYLASAASRMAPYSLGLAVTATVVGAQFVGEGITEESAAKRDGVAVVGHMTHRGIRKVENRLYFLKCLVELVFLFSVIYGLAAKGIGSEIMEGAVAALSLALAHCFRKKRNKISEELRCFIGPNVRTMVLALNDDTCLSVYLRKCAYNRDSIEDLVHTDLNARNNPLLPVVSKKQLILSVLKDVIDNTDNEELSPKDVLGLQDLGIQRGSDIFKELNLKPDMVEDKNTGTYKSDASYLGDNLDGVTKENFLSLLGHMESCIAKEREDLNRPSSTINATTCEVVFEQWYDLLGDLAFALKETAGCKESSDNPGEYSRNIDRRKNIITEVIKKLKDKKKDCLISALISLAIVAAFIMELLHMKKTPYVTESIMVGLSLYKIITTTKKFMSVSTGKYGKNTDKYEQIAKLDRSDKCYFVFCMAIIATLLYFVTKEKSSVFQKVNYALYGSTGVALCWMMGRTISKGLEKKAYMEHSEKALKGKLSTWFINDPVERLAGKSRFTLFNVEDIDE